jgi:hypothetical protein
VAKAEIEVWKLKKGSYEKHVVDYLIKQGYDHYSALEWLNAINQINKIPKSSYLRKFANALFNNHQGLNPKNVLTEINALKEIDNLDSKYRKIATDIMNMWEDFNPEYYPSYALRTAKEKEMNEKMDNLNKFINTLPI